MQKQRAVLRPVRETFRIAGGVDNLQLLYLGTFLAALVVVPIYGTLAKRMQRRRLLPVSYIFSAAVMAGFGLGMMVDPDNVWTARAFYVWLSVFNLFVILGVEIARLDLVASARSVMPRLFKQEIACHLLLTFPP